MFRQFHRKSQTRGRLPEVPTHCSASCGILATPLSSFHSSTPEVAKRCISIAVETAMYYCCLPNANRQHISHCFRPCLIQRIILVFRFLHVSAIRYTRTNIHAPSSPVPGVSHKLPKLPPQIFFAHIRPSALGECLDRHVQPRNKQLSTYRSEKTKRSCVGNYRKPITNPTRLLSRCFEHSLVTRFTPRNPSPDCRVARAFAAFTSGLTSQREGWKS